MKRPKRVRDRDRSAQRGQPDTRLPRVGLQIGWRFEAGRQVIQGVLDYAEERARPWDFAWDMTFDRKFPSLQKVDGMIALARDRDDTLFYKGLGIPVVLTTGRGGELPRVAFDDDAIGEMAARYYLDRGFTELAYYDHFTPRVDARLPGFTRAAAKAGVRVHAFPVTTADSSATFAKRARKIGRWLQSLPTPIGVFAYNDQDALEVAQVAHRLQIRIPDQIALLGVDNDSVLHRLCRPPLSSIDHGAHQLGYQSAKMLDDLMTRRTSEPSEVLISPIGVVSRQSTDTLAIRDPDVVMALRLIRNEACNRLRAETVIDRVSISRTSLETRFQKLLGRSVHQEIVRVRMEAAMHLLRATDLKMPEITQRSGFRYPSQVSHLFRKHVGMSPREYRSKMRTIG